MVNSLTYIFEFSLGSLMFLSVTAWAYFRQPRVRGPRQTAYTLLLLLGLVTAVFDIAAAILCRPDIAPRCPLALLYIANAGLIICVQACGPLLLLYTLLLTGAVSRLRGWLRLVCILPWVGVTSLILASPVMLRSGVFWFDEGNVYRAGSSHILLYAVTFLYFAATALNVILCRSRTSLTQRLTVYAFIALSFAAMAIQLIWPRYLVHATAEALALTMAFHTLQLPGEHIDPLTGVLNRLALPTMLTDMYDRGKAFTVLVCGATCISSINRVHGSLKGDEALCRVAAALTERYPVSRVFRMSGDVFAAVQPGPTDDAFRERTNEARAALAEALSGYADVKPTLFCTALPSSDCADAAAVVSAIGYITAEQRSSGDSADTGTGLYERFAYSRSVEAAIARALDNGGVSVCFQPILRSDGKLTALEALCRITDDRLGPIRPDLFIRIAEQNGQIHRLDEQVLRLVCRFIKESGAEDWQLDHIGVNLSIVECMQDGFAEHLASIVAEYGIRPGLISFEITETESAASLPMVCHNMRRLSELGIEFLLDDFGSGNANFDYISSMPFSCVKLDRSLLVRAAEERAQLVLLSEMAVMLCKLGLHSVCEGVETAEQSELVRSLGIEMQQGYYHSKPLPPDKLIEYVSKRQKEVTGA